VHLSLYTTAALLLCGLPSAVSAAYPDPSACPLGHSTNHIIDGIAYRNEAIVPMIHLKGGSWAHLSGNQSLESDYGKSILAVALMAYATQAKVRVDCQNGNDIRGIWIQD